MIATLLGHKQIQTTARYAHLARNSVQAAAARIADTLEADIDTRLHTPSIAQTTAQLRCTSPANAESVPPNAQRPERL